MTVLVLAANEDLHADRVVLRLNENRVETRRLDPFYDFGKELHYDLSEPNCIALGGVTFVPRRVSGVLCRLPLDKIYSLFAPRNVIEEFCLAEEESAWLTALASMPSYSWMNHPTTELFCSKKNYGLSVAQSEGLAVPKTLITNNTVRAREFLAGTRAVIKQISEFSVARQDGKYIEVPEANRFECPSPARICGKDIENEDELTSPILLQEFIESDLEFRVTVVDDRTFVAQAQLPPLNCDIKELGPELRYRAVVNSIVSDSVLRLSRRLGLRVVSYDIRLGQDSRYYVLDVNPMGNWLWLDDLFDCGISKAIADALSRPDTTA